MGPPYVFVAVSAFLFPFYLKPLLMTSQFLTFVKPGSFPGYSLVLLVVCVNGVCVCVCFQVSRNDLSLLPFFRLLLWSNTFRSLDSFHGPQSATLASTGKSRFLCPTSSGLRSETALSWATSCSCWPCFSIALPCRCVHLLLPGAVTFGSTPHESSLASHDHERWTG